MRRRTALRGALAVAGSNEAARLAGGEVLGFSRGCFFLLFEGLAQAPLEHQVRRYEEGKEVFGFGRIHPLGLQLLNESPLMTDDAGAFQNDICGMFHDHAAHGSRSLLLIP